MFDLPLDLITGVWRVDAQLDVQEIIAQFAQHAPAHGISRSGNTRQKAAAAAHGENKRRWIFLQDEWSKKHDLHISHSRTTIFKSRIHAPKSSRTTTLSCIHKPRIPRDQEADLITFTLSHGAKAIPTASCRPSNLGDILSLLSIYFLSHFNLFTLLLVFSS